MKQKNLLAIALTFLVMAGLLSGCQNSEKSSTKETSILTMDEVVKVNTVAYLLEQYKTVTYSQLDYIGGNTVHMAYFKDEKGNLCATEDDSGYKGYRTDTFTFSREKGESSYHINAMKDLNVSDYLFMVSGSEFTSQTTDESGNFVCETQADINQEFADQLSDIWQITTEDKMVTKTIFASDDYRVLSIDFILRRTDKSELKIASGVMIYDQEIQNTDAVQNYLDAEKITVSVNMEDGSIRKSEIPKGETYTWYCDEGYALYLDENGKMPISDKSEPVQSDLTLYCLPTK